MLRTFYCLLILLFPTLAMADKGVAIFAGGCFWCMESAYQDREGVVDVVSGFTGGKSQNPSYQGDHRGHYEAIKITYDTTVITYSDLLDSYWLNIDPFDANGQFCDKGASYRSAIFVADGSEREQAEASRDKVAASFPQQRVVTQILPASSFWPVEEAHQDYYRKNPVRYKYYRWNCGRDQRLRDIWGDQAGH